MNFSRDFIQIENDFFKTIPSLQSQSSNIMFVYFDIQKNFKAQQKTVVFNIKGTRRLTKVWIIAFVTLI